MRTFSNLRPWAPGPVMMLPARPWLPPPTDLALSNDDVHVWRATLERNGAYVETLQQILSADERARAERFHFDRDRKGFIVARGLLRLILSRYLDMEPDKLYFCHGAHGKPGLITTSDQEALSFNASHSRGLALYAISRSRKVGIDLECIDTDFDCEPIAERFFSPREKATLRSLQSEQMKLMAFFNCWTRKEAYIKAQGAGLSLPLDQFDVSLLPGEPARLLNTSGDPLEVSRWHLKELFPGPGYVAALAVEGHSCPLACWEWPE